MRSLIVALTALALNSCQTAPPTQVEAKTKDERITVAVQLPRKRTLSTETSLTGEFRPYQQVDLYAKVSGYVRKIHVDVGTPVRGGAVIAELDTPELQAELDQAAAGRRTAESELTRAKAEVLRHESAVALAKTNTERLQGVNRKEAGLIAQQEIDNAQARWQEAESHAAAARAQVTAAGQQVEAAAAAEARAQSMLGYSRVTAPFSGLVVKRNADTGALIQAGTSSNGMPLVVVADISRLRLAVSVPESLAAEVRPGAPVEVNVPALRQTFPARVSRFTGNVQTASRTTEVEIDVANPSQRILPGMVADVTLPVESGSDSLTVPVQSLSNLGGNRYVLIVTDSGTIEERQIKTGVEAAAEVEVVAGLQGTERIITSSRALLRPGMQVDYRVEGAAR